MTDLVHYDPTDTWVPMLGAVGDLAQKVAQTQFVPKSMRGTPAAVAAAILLGREMGLGPMASLRGIDVIEGKPALTAQMLAARILAAGHSIEWPESTDTRCTVRITRADGLSAAEVTWTRADAERAGLWGKGAWRGYPRHMLRHRALSEAAGMACPDVALGLDVGESGPDEPNRTTSGTTVVQVQTPPRQMHSVEEVHQEPRTPEPVAIPAPQESDSPVVEPQPERNADMITGPQRRKIGALIGQLEKHDGHRMDRQERRDFIAALLELPDLGSANDLTKQQAGDVIDRLEALLVDVKPADDAEVIDGEVIE